MVFGRSNMDLLRRRTRGQWEEFYKNVSKTQKKKKSFRGDGNRGVTRNVDYKLSSYAEQDFVLVSDNGLAVHKDVESTRGIKKDEASSGNIKRDGVIVKEEVESVSLEDQELLHIGDNGFDVNKDIESFKKYDAGSGDIRRNVVEERGGAGNLAPSDQILHSKGIHKGVVINSASVGRSLQEKKVSEVANDKKGYDDAFFSSGEEVRLNDSNLRSSMPNSVPESKVDSYLDPGNFDDYEKKNGNNMNACYDSESWNSVSDSLGSDRMVEYSDSGDSVPNSRVSDANVDDLSLSESSSEDNDDSSDADYKEDEQWSSEDTYVSYANEKEDGCNSDDDDGNDCLLNVQGKKNRAGKIDGSKQNYKLEDGLMCSEEKNGASKIDELVKNRKNDICLDDENVDGYSGDVDKDESICQLKREHKVKKKECSKIMQEKGQTDDNGLYGHEVRVNGMHSSEKNEGLVFLVDLDEKLPSLKTSASKKRRFGGLKVLVDFNSNSDDMINQTNSRKRPRHSTNSNYQNRQTPKCWKSTHKDVPFMYTEKKSMLKEDHQSSREKNVIFLKKKAPKARDIDFIKLLINSITSLQDQVTARVKVNDISQNYLPLKFKFDEDVVRSPPEKSEYEKEIESLFFDMELALQQIEIEDAANCRVTEIDEVTPIEIDNSPKAKCERGDHQLILDEQIGVKCQYCNAVVLEIRHVLPDFCTRSLRRQERRGVDELPIPMTDDGIQFQNSTCGPQSDPFSRPKGTVWDLIPGVENDLFPHQREGYEFIWKNIVGGIIIDELRETLTDDDGRGCIISHAPGTGKSRLAILFLTAFLKLYPNSRPLIIAPKGMLLTWEEEFKKWKVDVAFYNVNNSELSGRETRVFTELASEVGNTVVHKKSNLLVKLYSWMKGGGVLGISYSLFERITRENNKEKGYDPNFLRSILLTVPGLLILDEGHTPRNDKSRIWNALTNVATQRRIILSGTPFQNNFIELKNTLCIVYPKFVTNKKWKALTNSIGEDSNRLEKLRGIIDPFVHVHEGTILQKNLPGLRETMVFLRPTDLQNSLLEVAIKDKNHLRGIHNVSLVSVHPSMVAEQDMFSALKEKLHEIDRFDTYEGVKMQFVINIVKLAARVDERVLIFGQYIHPLNFIMEQLKTHLGWNLGREVLYIDGNLKDKHRQESISSFNNHLSDAKVLLASERACSEGINLIGASRVVLLDTVWNPSVERQAISRAYRYGQKKVVHVYRLIISRTEVRQYELQSKKEFLSQQIFSRANDEERMLEIPKDKILEAMTGLNIFEKVIHEPKTSDWIDTFGLADLQKNTL